MVVIAVAIAIAIAIAIAMVTTTIISKEFTIALFVCVCEFCVWNQGY